MPKKKSPEKEQSSTSSKSKVTSWLNKIEKNKKFKGVAQVRRACDMNTPYYLRRPTGVTTLDLALGGGLHAGGGVEIFGGQSVGKTGLAFRTAGMVQKHYGEDANILIVSTEIRPDKSYARRNGFLMAYSNAEIEHFSRMRHKLGKPPFSDKEIADFKTQIGEVMVVTAATGDKALDVAVSALEEGIFQLIIIESLGALLTPDQDDKDTGERVYGGNSLIVTSFQNKMYPLYMMDREDGSLLETTVLGINQVRADMTMSRKTTRSAASAFAWKHGQLASIELKRGAPIRESSSGPPIGREVNWELVKGKVGTHDGRKDSYNYFHVPTDEPVMWSEVKLVGSQYGVDTITDLVKAAKVSGALDVSGSWLTWARGEEVITRCHGSAELAQMLVDDDKYVDMLREDCMKAAGLQVKYR